MEEAPIDDSGQPSVQELNDQELLFLSPKQMNEDGNSSDQDEKVKNEKLVIKDVIPQNMEMTSRTPNNSKVIKISDLMDKPIKDDIKSHRTWAKSMINDQQMQNQNGRAISSSSSTQPKGAGNSHSKFLNSMKSKEVGKRETTSRNSSSSSLALKQPQQKLQTAQNLFKRQTTKAPQPNKKLAVNTEKTGCYSPKISVNNKKSGFSTIETAYKVNPSVEDEEFKTQASPVTLNINYPDIDIPKAKDIFQHDENNQIKVVIRVRPFNQREIDDPDNKECVSIEKNASMLSLEKGADIKKFNFDFVGHSQIDQQSIFNHIARPIADSCLQGYNGTIFAYGQTGAGKTFTIQGPSLQFEEEVENQRKLMEFKNQRGIMQRSFEYIFDCINAEQSIIDQKSNGSALQFLVKCSFLEIYNEQIMDLLEPSQVNLQVREDINKGVYVESLCEEAVESQQDMLELIERGARNRHVGATSMNRQSSRSHSVLTTIIESKSRSATGVWNVKQSRFHIIDLAGSERQKVAGTQGDRLKEAGMINKSLSALGNVINSLVDVSEGRNRHVPYRDSKLTFILRDSLGGNSKTVIIANISPSVINFSETLSTLKFAQRAKLIRNKAVINEDSSGTLVLLKNEIKKLKRDLTESMKQVSVLENEKILLSQCAAENIGKVCMICKKDPFEEEEDELLDQNLINADQLEYSQYTSEDRVSDPFQTCKEIPKLPQVTRNSEPSKVLDQDVSMQPKNIKNIAKQLSSMSRTSDAHKVIGQLNERIIAAESILNSNLFIHTNNEQQIENLKDQNLKLMQSLELYEVENTQLKQFLAKKEEIIAKFETNTRIEQLQSEIEYLKEIIKKQIEKEQTPKVLKLEAQLLEKKMPMTDQSLNSKISQQAQVITELNDYFSQKCSLQAYYSLDQKNKELLLDLDRCKNDLLQLEIKHKDLQDEQDVLVSQNIQLDEGSQKLTREYGRAKVEIQMLKDSNQKQEEEMQTLSKDKNFSQIIINQMKDEIAVKEKQMIDIIAKNEETQNQNIQQLAQMKENSQMKLEQKVQQMNEEKQQILKQNEKIIEQLNQQNQSINESTKIKDQLLKENESTMEQLIKENEHIKVLTDELNKENLALKNKIETLSQENQSLQQKMQTDVLSQKQQYDQEADKIMQKFKQENMNLKEEHQKSITEQINQLQVLKDQMAQKEYEIKSIKDQIIHKETEIQALKDQQAQKESELQALKDELIQKENESQSFRELKENEIKVLKDNFEQKNLELQKNSQQIEQAQNELTDKYSKLDQLQQSLKEENLSLQQKINDLSSKLKDFESAKDSLENEVNQTKAETLIIVDDLNLKLSESSEQLTNLRKIITQQTEVIESSKKQIQTSQNNYNKLSDKLSEKTVQIQKLEFSNIEKIDALNLQIEEKEGEISELTKQMQELKASQMTQIKDKNEQLKKYQEEIDALKQQYEKQIKNIETELIDQTTKSQEDIKILRNEQSALTSQIDCLEEQKKQEQCFNKALREELENLQKQLVGSNEDLKQKQQQNQVNENKLLESENKVQMVKELNFNLQTEIQNTQDQIQSLSNQIQEATAEAQNIKNKYHKEKQSNQKLVNENIENLQKIQDLINEKKEIEKNVQNQKSELDQLKNQLDLERNDLQFQLEAQSDELQGKIKGLESEIESHKTTNKALISELETNLVSKDSQIKQLQQDIQVKIQQQNDQISIISDKTQLIETLEQNNDKLQNEVKKYQDHILSVEKESSRIESEYKLKLQGLESESREKTINLTTQISELNAQLTLQNSDRANKQDEFIREMSKLQELLKETNFKNLILDSSIDQIKACCYKKIELIQNNDQITEILQQMGCIDDDMEELKVQSNQSHPCSEINLLVSQIVFEFTKLYEGQFSELKAKERSKTQQAQKDLQIIAEKYEKLKNESSKLKENKEKLLHQYGQQESYQKEKMQSQQTLHDKTVKELQAEIKTNKDQTGKMKKQLKEAETQLNNEKQKTASLDMQLIDEIDEKQKILTELNEYKMYLPEAESLLQEVNKRHQNTQKDLDQALSENTKLKTQHQSVIQSQQAKIEKQKTELEVERRKYQNLQESMQRNIDNQEFKFSEVQDQVNILAQSSKQAKQEKEDLWKQNQELIEKVNNTQKRINKLQDENFSIKETIDLREQEMREVVKTLKEFSQDKKKVEKENEKLKLDVKLLTGAQNPSYKIQLLMKIKEENNMLKEQIYQMQDKYLKSQSSSFDDGQIQALLKHISQLPQFEIIASEENIDLSNVQDIMKLLTQIDFFLRFKDSSPVEPNISITSGTGHQNKILPKLGEYQKSRPNIYFEKSREAQEEIEQTINYLPTKLSRQKEQTRSTDQVPLFKRKNSIIDKKLQIQSIDDSFMANEQEYEHQVYKNLTSQNKAEEKKISCQFVNKDKPVILNSYSSIYKQQRDHSKNSKTSAREEILTSERFKEKDVINHVPVSNQRPQLNNSSSLGEPLVNKTSNKHKQFKQNQMKHSSTTRGVSYRIEPLKPNMTPRSQNH